ncbi:MAG: dihydrolipoamide acetyltransferase family protein [Solitalea-like symbiont of Tyrophagus putrescentiae]
MTNEPLTNTIQLIMPQIGEGVTHVTVKKWLKQPGDSVGKDENILEVFSDKVDILIQSTNSGILEKQLVQANEELQIKSPYALLNSAETGSARNIFTDNKSINNQQTITTNILESKNEEIDTAADFNPTNVFYSPLVKSITKKENISDEELSLIKGSGKDGRIIKDDILNYVKSRSAGSKHYNTKDNKNLDAVTPNKAGQSQKLKDGDNIIPMDNIRKIIATNMIKSKQISPHVSSVVEADVTKIVEWKNNNQQKFLSKNGIKLTFTPIFTEAVAKSLVQYPMINSSVDNDNIIMHKDINIGIATALPNGNLIVPVIKCANEKNIIGLAKDINDLAQKARQNNLSPNDINQGTFTITNMAPFNNIMAFPIIKQPEVAILAIGKITKRVVVTKDNAIAIRDMVYLTLTYDHRIIDGALGGKFLYHIASVLENFEQQTTNV